MKRTAALGAIVTLAALGFFFWLLHGSMSWLWRGVTTSASWKLGIAALAVGGLIALFATTRGAKNVGGALGSLAVVVAVGMCIGAPFGGFARQTSYLPTVQTVQADQPQYDWRQPWVTAAKGASSLAGDVTGDFDNSETWYLPAINAYATPVVRRGGLSQTFNGYNQVLVQHADHGTSEVCDFRGDAPRNHGWMGNNLRRALSFVSSSLTFFASDVWVYCDTKDDNTAKLVVPVERYASTFEGHLVPAGIVIFDGQTSTWLREASSEDVPGPVYSATLAEMQRKSTVAVDGWWAQTVTKKAGYEIATQGNEAKVDSDKEGSEDADPDQANPAELLLSRTDHSGYDYVTALTPRGGSTSIVAVSTIDASHVKDGVLNPVTVHRLKAPRVGNVALYNRAKAAFTEMNWNANSLRIVEVIPTSDDVWTATIANGTVAQDRIEVHRDGLMCRTDLAGKPIRCVNADNAEVNADGTPIKSAPTPVGEGEASAVEGSDLTSMSDADLISLQQQVAAEMASRLREVPVP